jgi:hypothetical protein
MCRAWKSRAAQLWSRQLFIAFLSVIHIVLFIAASILVVYATTIGTDGQVLLRGQDTCDWWFNPSDSSPSSSFWSVQREILQDSNTYAKACYRADTSELDNSPACRTFSTPSLDFETKTGVPCPFQDKKFCRKSAEGPIQIVSQLINSNDHLGVNAAVADQINFRQSMVCSPMPDTPDTKFASEVSLILSGTIGTSDIRERAFHYGPRTGTNSSTGSNSTGSDNYTFGSMWTNSSTPDPYQFQYAAVYHNRTDSADFKPIPGLMPDEADLSIILLTNSAMYTTPFNDTLFGTDGPNNGTRLYSGRRFAVLGCTHQYEFCNPVNGLCTAAGGWDDIGDYSEDKRHFKLWDDDGLTPLQHGTISNIRVAAAFTGIGNILGLGSNSLLAAQKLSSARDGVSLPLQNNQTVVELQNWFATSLAALQHAFYFHPLSPALPASEASIRNSGLQELCQRQKIRDPNYTSFSVVALAIIISFGGVIILASLALPALTGILRKQFGSDMHSQNEWDANELLYLQSKFEPTDFQKICTKSVSQDQRLKPMGSGPGAIGNQPCP